MNEMIVVVCRFLCCECETGLKYQFDKLYTSQDPDSCRYESGDSIYIKLSSVSLSILKVSRIPMSDFIVNVFTRFSCPARSSAPCL